jgi:hypothetical protein
VRERGRDGEREKRHGRCSTAQISKAQKKLVDTKMTNGQKSKIICPTCNKNCFRAVSLLDKNK